MSSLASHVCQCPLCRQSADHLDRELHRQMNAFPDRLDGQQRRWYVALGSRRMGQVGDSLLSQITGTDEKTIRRGREELDSSLEDRPGNRVRLPPGQGALPLKKRPGQ